MGTVVRAFSRARGSHDLLCLATTFVAFALSLTQVSPAWSQEQPSGDLVPASPEGNLIPAPAPAPPPPAPVPHVVAPPVPSPAPAKPAPDNTILAVIAGAVAVVGVTVGTIYGIKTLEEKSQYDQHPTSAIANDGSTDALVCDVSYGVALALGVMSLILVLEKGEPSPPAAAPSHAAARKPRRDPVTFSAAPVVGPHTGGAGLSLTF